MCLFGLLALGNVGRFLFRFPFGIGTFVFERRASCAHAVTFVGFEVDVGVAAFGADP